MIEKQITMSELASALEMDLTNPEFYDLSGLGLEVESIDDDGNSVFKEISEFLVKPKVDKYYKLGSLRGTGNHRVMYDGDFIKLKNHPDAELVNEEMNVVDISVLDTERYLANGYVNHNTTSGGLV